MAANWREDWKEDLRKLVIGVLIGEIGRAHV